MKKTFLLALSALLLTGLSGCKQPQPASDEPEPAAQVVPSHIDLYPQFHSQYVPSRTIRVWVPAGYDSTARYDVLYMHDGLMLFDASITWNKQEWGVDEAMDSLTAKGLIRPTIVVGIDNRPEMADRISEYCPDDVAQLLPQGKQLYDGLVPMKGNDYLRFVVEEVKPFIDSFYRTYKEREHTWTMGSSCGGLISSYALCKYPNVFGGAACMSTHSTLAIDTDHPDPEMTKAYVSYLQQHIAVNSCRLYFDRGDRTLDANYSESQAAINAMLESAGWDEAHFLYRFFPGASHTEDSWRARLDVPLRFLLAK